MFEPKMMDFGADLPGGLLTMKGSHFSSEKLLCIMSNVGGWWGFLSVSAKRSPWLNVGY